MIYYTMNILKSDLFLKVLRLDCSVSANYRVVAYFVFDKFLLNMQRDAFKACEIQYGFK